MKRIPDTVRPAWALALDTFLSLIIAVVLAKGTDVLWRGHAHRIFPFWSESVAGAVAELIGIPLIALIGVLCIWGYRWLKIHHYPATFVYCFRNDDGVYTLGSLVLELKIEAGQFEANGRAYDWKHDGTKWVILPEDPKQPHRWKSLFVGCTGQGEGATCFMGYEIENRPLYSKGLLSFRFLLDAPGLVDEGQDSYRGNIYRIVEDKDKEGTSTIHVDGTRLVPLSAYVYAERLNMGKKSLFRKLPFMDEESRKKKLERCAQNLINGWNTRQ